MTPTQILSALATGSTHEDWSALAPHVVSLLESPASLREAAKLAARWPKEITREPKRATPEQKARLLATRVTNSLRETDTYPVYIAGICGHPALSLPTPPRQAVHLERAYTGKLDDRRIGTVGQADLRGGLTVEVNGRRLCLELAVEVKMPGGKLEPEQIAWRDAAIARGVLYVEARSVAQAVADIARLRDEALRFLSDPRR